MCHHFKDTRAQILNMSLVYSNLKKNPAFFVENKYYALSKTVLLLLKKIILKISNLLESQNL